MATGHRFDDQGRDATAEPSADTPAIVWTPPDDAARMTNLGRFAGRLAESANRAFGDYDALHAWSIANIGRFWEAVADDAQLRFRTPPTAALGTLALPGTTWFPGATLSYSEHALRHGNAHPDEPAVISVSQTRDSETWSWERLRHEVAALAAWLRGEGVARGDRVAGYLPNIPEAIAAFLATASIGATWVCCAPEFGTRAVLDRLRQVEPVVLLAIDGYRYGDKVVRRDDELGTIRDALASVRGVLRLSYLGHDAPSPGMTDWDEIRRGTPVPLEHEAVPFDHPLYVLFSSGTTGLPKPIVHGTGGILIEHWKALALHHDLDAGERFFWFTTTGWMMWNYFISALLAGGVAVCFDGDPGSPDLSTLWRMVDETGCVTFGTSASFLVACERAGLRPGELVSGKALREIGSTGSPLPEYIFMWLAAELPGVKVNSMSGGTDVCTAFVGANPLVPVWAGEISRPLLGCDIAAYRNDGTEAATGEDGELVVRAPLPSMPVALWGDEDGSRYRAAYFEHFEGVWNHGDWIRFTERGSCVISGRSDATLNRSGVRIGTAEIYAVVESLPGVLDSLAVHVEDGDSLVLFVATDTTTLEPALVEEIRLTLRRELSPRHVPDRIVQVPAVPRTPTGKKLEVAVKRLLQGAAPERAFADAAVADPAAVTALVEAVRREEGENDL